MTDDAAMNPLVELLAHLEHDGEVPPAWVAAPAAIQHANTRGGEDNITALFVELVAGM